MLKLKLVSFVLLASILAACGPSKKKDQGPSVDDDKGKTGQGQQGDDQKNRNPPPRVPTFAQYCASKGGSLWQSDQVCGYKYLEVTAEYPKNATGVTSIYVGSVFQGMVVITQGDPSGAADLYVSDNGRLTKFLPINEKVNRGVIGAMNVGLSIVALEKYEKAAHVTVWKCENPQYGVATCPF